MGPSILVVDDERSILDLVQNILTREGFQITTATNGAEGLEKIRASKFELIICDVLMPEMNGLEFLEAVVKTMPRMEIILMTGHGDVQMAVEALKNGAFDFIQKPFNGEEFLHRINNALERRHLRELVKAQEEILQAEKLISIGRLVTGIAHEINNPLTSIIGYSQFLIDSKPPDNILKPLQTMNEQAKRCGKIVQDLMIFGHRKKKLETAQWINPLELIRQVVQELESEIRANNIKVTLPLGESKVQIWAENARLRAVFNGILKNAVQALEAATGAKTIKIEINQTDDHWRVTITDSGPGIPQPIQNKVFDPFFTTKEVGQGSGLGLSMALGIVQEHGGHISLKSEAGKGTAFCVEMPLTPPPADGSKQPFVS